MGQNLTFIFHGQEYIKKNFHIGQNLTFFYGQEYKNIFHMGQNLINLFFSHWSWVTLWSFSSRYLTLNENMWYCCQILHLQNIAAKLSLWWFLLQKSVEQLYIFAESRRGLHNGCIWWNVNSGRNPRPHQLC